MVSHGLRTMSGLLSIFQNILHYLTPTYLSGFIYQLNYGQKKTKQTHDEQDRHRLSVVVL